MVNILYNFNISYFNYFYLIGTLIYTVFLRKKNIRIVFALTIIIAFFIRLTPEILVTGLNSYLGIPGDIFAISDS